MITKKKNLRPRKATREKPKAARLASKTTATVMIEDVRKLLKYQRSMLPPASISPKDSRVKPDGGIQVTGTVVVSFSTLSAVSTAHASGMSQTIAARRSTAKASQPMILSRIPVPATLERSGALWVPAAIRASPLLRLATANWARPTTRTSTKNT